jgi:predicted adenine nucleotide alpha hydrolase (AANH) superfamily ATPase
MEDEYGLRGFVGGLYGDGPPADGGPDCLKPPRRCAFFYRLWLEKTAAAAAAGAYDAFSTTLLISPYQAHELIRAAAEEAAARHGPAFLYRDFRPRFRQGREEGRARGYYMQKYCGCIFSEEERYLSSKEI